MLFFSRELASGCTVKGNIGRLIQLLFYHIHQVAARLSNLVLVCSFGTPILEIEGSTSTLVLDSAEFIYKRVFLGFNLFLTLWRPLLPYGHSYKASSARPG